MTKETKKRIAEIQEGKKVPGVDNRHLNNSEARYRRLINGDCYYVKVFTDKITVPNITTVHFSMPAGCYNIIRHDATTLWFKRAHTGRYYLRTYSQYNAFWCKTMVKEKGVILGSYKYSHTTKSGYLVFELKK